MVVWSASPVDPLVSTCGVERRAEFPALGSLAAVSWPWVPAWGSLEPSRPGGGNAQKTGKKGAKMGEIRPKKCEQGRERRDHLLAPQTSRPGAPDRTVRSRGPCSLPWSKNAHFPIKRRNKSRQFASFELKSSDLVGLDHQTGERCFRTASQHGSLSPEPASFMISRSSRASTSPLSRPRGSWQNTPILQPKSPPNSPQFASF